MSERTLVQQIFDIGVDQKITLLDWKDHGKGSVAAQIRKGIDLYIQKGGKDTLQDAIDIINSKIKLLQAYTDSGEVRVVIANLEQVRDEIKDKLILK